MTLGGRLLSWGAAAAALAWTAGALADAPAAPDNVLRVCADPNNMPLSNQSGEGYENRIAELLAHDLGWKLEYTWFPQRMGFVRNTLKAKDPDQDHFKCDLVIGVPVGYELTLTTPAYYRSTWAMVLPVGKGLDDIQTPADLLKIDPARLKKLRFGLVGRSPPTDWLLKNNLIDQAVSVPTQSGDPAAYPGQMIQDQLASGQIDVAFAWGPIAGYFAKHAKAPGMRSLPFPPDPDIHFDFRIAMGVRFGEKDWRDRIAGLIARDGKQIDEILLSYGVPLLDDKGNPIQAAN
ncbi:MAG TPA: substrate-binding domain-containing protein [Burkholderiaceae bacterium]|nr:substrate-binding domain-containing protein [Burkholderiaceae bacterium]